MINEIYRLKTELRYEWNYVGTLRNEKRFNIHDNVFFAFNTNEIARGQIVGVELPPDENPEFIYKIKIPQELVEQQMRQQGYEDFKDLDKVVLKCDRIFSTLEEAKQSAIEQLDKLYNLQKNEIEYYFKNWGNKL